MENLKQYGLIVFILLAIVSSCKKDKNTSPSPGESIRTLGSFSSIDYRLPFKLTLQNGAADQYEVRLLGEGEQKYNVNKIKTKIANDELIIYADENLAESDMTVIIFTPTFQNLKITHSANPVIQNTP